MTLLFCLFHSEVAISQCINPVLDAGLYCNTDATDSPAPIICNVDCLDGFTATMPSSILPDQPSTLCGGSGTPNNMSWFAFVAGDTFLDITITPNNCQPGSVFSGNPADDLIGIQAGIYSSCSFEAEDVIACFWDCHGTQGDPVNLTSNEFIAGEVYYLFVDGCGGSVCDYTVSLNSAMQAFEIPEITNIYNEYNYDFEKDTICQGAEIMFILDGLDLDINFSWTIDPPIAEYPSGMHPETDTNIVEFVFSDEGVFDIIVFAYNECDSNEPDTFQVVVKPLGDEVFSDVVLCEECIEAGFTLISPDAGCIIGDGVPLVLTEDPNGDGVTGWQGFTEVTGPGLEIVVVQNVMGCDFTQSVNIVEIPLQPREYIDLYFCFDEFPKNIDGVMFNNPGTSRDITIDGGASSGCDSLINITAHGIDFFGNAMVSECIDGMISITYNMSFVEPTDYDSIVYFWQDAQGIEVLDEDNIDNVLEVMNPGAYTVEITVYKDGADCLQSFGTYNVDAESLIPDMPMVSFAPNQICITQDVALIYVNNQGLGEEYEWTTNPALPITYGLTNDTAYVDISSGQDFEFCILAKNGCGESDQFCDDVTVSEVPSAIFTVPSEICIDSTFWVEYIGGDGTSSNTEFYWSFSGANVLSNAGSLSSGPFELQFDAIGDYTISMYLLEASCESLVEQHTIKVTAPFVAPSIMCHSLTAGVAFSFDDSLVDGFEVEVLTGQAFEIIGTDSIFVANLGPEEEVEISILFNDDHVCGGQIGTSNCMSLPCPDIDFEVMLSNQNQCIEENIDPIKLTINIIGNDTGIGEWISPFINDDNEFDVSTAGAGVHDISYTYDVVGCNFSIDTSIYVYSSPVLEYDIELTYCEDDVIARILIEAGDNVLSINGVEAEDYTNVEISEAGTYNVQLTNADGCSTYEDIAIEPIEIDPSLIIGDTDVVAGNNISFETNDLGPLPDIVYSWYLDGELLCDDCTEVDFEVEKDDLELCMIATYDQDCVQEVCVDLSVIVITELYVPNIFSPNGDGINDDFKFQSNSDDLMIESITIFDRWGALMFEAAGSISNEEAIMWDGTFNGSPVNGGVYIYIIRYLDLEGRMVQKSGDITLMR